MTTKLEGVGVQGLSGRTTKKGASLTLREKKYLFKIKKTSNMIALGTFNLKFNSALDIKEDL